MSCILKLVSNSSSYAHLSLFLNTFVQSLDGVKGKKTPHHNKITFPTYVSLCYLSVILAL